MTQSKKEYPSSALISETPTSLFQLDSNQNRAQSVNGLPTNENEDHRIQPLSHRREVGAATLFIHFHDPRNEACFVRYLNNVHHFFE